MGDRGTGGVKQGAWRAGGGFRNAATLGRERGQGRACKGATEFGDGDCPYIVSWDE